MQVEAYYKSVKDRGIGQEKAWNELFAKYKQAFPDLGAELERRLKGEFKAGWKDAFPRYKPSDAAVATRQVYAHAWIARLDSLFSVGSCPKRS